MKFELIEDADRIQECAAEWNALVRRASGSIHSTPEWLLAWWRHHASRARKLHVVTAREAGQLAAVAPLMQVTIPGLRGLADERVFSFIGTGPSDYADLLVAPEHEGVREGLLAHVLRAAERWDRVELREVPETSATAGAMRRLASRQGHEYSVTQSDGCFFLALSGDVATFEAGLSRNLRKKLRRAEHRLAEIGPIELRRVDRFDPALWQCILDVNARYAKATARQDLGTSPRFGAYIRDVFDTLGEAGWLDLAGLFVGGRCIAYNLGFVYEGTAYAWNGGFDPDFASRHPGKLLLTRLIADSIERGLVGFDFMRGGEDYKRNWTRDLRWNTTLVLRNRSLSVRARRSLRNAVARLREPPGAGAAA